MDTFMAESILCKESRVQSGVSEESKISSTEQREDKVKDIKTDASENLQLLIDFLSGIVDVAIGKEIDWVRREYGFEEGSRRYSIRKLLRRVLNSNDPVIALYANFGTTKAGMLQFEYRRSSLWRTIQFIESRIRG